MYVCVYTYIYTHTNKIVIVILFGKASHVISSILNRTKYFKNFYKERK